MRISDWSSDVCSSDLAPTQRGSRYRARMLEGPEVMSGHCKSIKLNDYLARAPSGDAGCERRLPCSGGAGFQQSALARRSEEHTSELQSLMRISYAVFCLKKKHPYPTHTTYQTGCTYPPCTTDWHALGK